MKKREVGSVLLAQLYSTIKHMPKDSNLIDTVLKAAQNTHSEAHKNLRIQVRHVFDVQKQTETLRYSTFEKHVHNKFLLWHGCRPTSLAAAFREGLKLPSKESSDTGLMFGKGIYLTDCFSKAAS